MNNNFKLRLIAGFQKNFFDHFYNRYISYTKLFN